MAGSNTLRFDIVGDASSASRAFRSAADGAALAARGAKQLSDSLAIQSKSAVASAGATLALAKSDQLLADAEAELAASADEAGRQLQQQGRAAEEAALKTRVAGDAAKGAGSGFGVLATPIGAAVAAGVALAPVLVTVGVGLGGLAAAAYKTVAPILQAGTATKQAQQALASLDPAQKAAYLSLGALKTQFGGFAKSLEPETIGLFGQALGIASGALHDIQPIAAATGKALGVVLGEVRQEFHSGEWQQFFKFMAQSAGPDVQLLGKLFIDLTNDLPPLLEELQPVAQGILIVADDTAKLAGALNLLNPSLSSTTVASAKTQQSTGGLVGSFEHLIGQGKVLVSQVTGIGKSTDATSKAMTRASASTDKTGASAAAAAPKVGTLSGDVALLSTSTTNAATALSAYNDAWLKIVGTSLSDQQAVLADESAFDGLTTAIKNSGGQSLQARQAFVSYVQQVGATVSTLQQNGASVKDINAEYTTNIKRLQSLHNLTPQQRADVQGLIRDYDTWAASTAGLNKQTATAAQTVKDKFTANLKALGEFLPQTNTDVNNLAASVLRTGTQSQATQKFRAQLIKDLEQAGIDGQSAAGKVDGLEASIGRLKGKTVAVNVTIGGEGAIVAAAVGLPARIFKLSHLAAGGQVAGSGSGDTVPAMLTPGEVVVPKGMVAGGAVDHLRGKLPGFAAGGLVDAAPWAGGEASGAAGGWAGSWVQGEVAAFIKAAKAAQQLAGTPVAYSKVAGVTQWEPDVSKVLSWLGLPQADLPTVMSQIQTESGGNPNAINLTDINAQHGDPSKGLMQVISGTFAAYRNPSLSSNIYDPLANIFAGVNYAVHRYGNPGWLSVLGHGHGYANGTSSAQPGLAVVGERGPEIVRFGGGEQVIPNRSLGGGDVHVHLHNQGVIGSQQELKRWLLESTRELARVKGGGNVQRAFGKP